MTSAECIEISDSPVKKSANLQNYQPDTARVQIEMPEPTENSEDPNIVTSVPLDQQSELLQEEGVLMEETESVMAEAEAFQREMEQELETAMDEMDMDVKED